MLTLTYRASTSIPVEVEGLTPTFARSKTLDEVRRFGIFHGNEKLPLAELFDVAGDPEDGRLRFEGNLAGVHWIGAGMSEGSIHVAGPAGRHVGSDMTDGEIYVDGDAGDWVGAEMHGGLIHVRGRAGHLVGAAYQGSRRGMSGGTILIGGDAGNEVGYAMRRGLLVVGGSAGDCTGLGMIAGSIYIFGSSGIRPGAGMRRGTIGLFGPEPIALLPTFYRGCRFRPAFLAMTYRWLQERGFPLPSRLLTGEVLVYHGDLLEGGRGEILLGTGTA
jgi:formylmethanofuran dehydrogenase subunit C